MEELFACPAGQPPYYSDDLGGWVLSRHADVLVAMRTAELMQGQNPPDARNRRNAIDAIASLKIQDLKPEIEELTRSLLQSLSTNRPVDLVGEFLHPWSVGVVCTALRSPKGQRRRIGSIGRYITGSTADARKKFLKSGSAASRARRCPELAWLVVRQRVAQWDLRRLCRELQLPGLKSTFLGITQTLPSFLANAWLDLLWHPVELQKLRHQPELIANAIDELLRHAGLVHTLTRRAAKSIRLCGVNIAEGQQVFLRVAEANHDPLQFVHAERLDVSARDIRHLALGAGYHSCVGAALVHMSATIATTELLRRFPSVRLVESTVSWQRGAVQYSPTAVMVRFDRGRSQFEDNQAD